MRNSLPYPHEHPGLSRRKWLELAGLGGAGALMSLALSSDSVPEKALNFSEWYHQHVHPDDTIQKNSTPFQEHYRLKEPNSSELQLRQDLQVPTTSVVKDQDVREDRVMSCA